MKWFHDLPVPVAVFVGSAFVLFAIGLCIGAAIWVLSLFDGSMTGMWVAIVVALLLWITMGSLACWVVEGWR